MQCVRRCPASGAKFTPVFLAVMDRMAERKAAAQETGDIETAECLAAMYDGIKPEDYLVEPIREIKPAH